MDNSSWVVIGDFNAILDSSKKHGGILLAKDAHFLVISWIMQNYLIWDFEAFHSLGIEGQSLKD